MTSSVDVSSVLEELKLKNEQFDVLQEKFLEQRKELFDAKKTDSNKEYVTLLEGKLKKAMEKNADLEKKMEGNQEKATEELKEISMKWESERMEKMKREDEVYWNLAQINSLVNYLGIGTDDVEDKERMKEKVAHLKQNIASNLVMEVSNTYFSEAVQLIRNQDSVMANMTKELVETKALSDSHKKRAEELEDKLRFDMVLNNQIQERINDITTSLSYHKTLVAELEAEKEKTRRAAEGIIDNDTMADDGDLGSEDDEDDEDETESEEESDFESDQSDADQN